MTFSIHKTSDLSICVYILFALALLFTLFSVQPISTFESVFDFIKNVCVMIFLIYFAVPTLWIFNFLDETLF